MDQDIVLINKGYYAKVLDSVNSEGSFVMAKSFRLDDGGDKDKALTVALLLISLLISMFYLYMHLHAIGVTIHFGPLIVFVLTRALYKRHFRRQIAALKEKQDRVMYKE